MPKKKRPPRPGQFGAPAAVGPAKCRKAEEELQKAGATQLRVLQQDKGPTGNSIAETARSAGQAARATAQRAAARQAAEAAWPALLDELMVAVAAEAYACDLEQDRLVKIEVERLVVGVLERVQQQEWQEELDRLYNSGLACPLCDWKAAVEHREVLQRWNVARTFSGGAEGPSQDELGAGGHYPAGHPLGDYPAATTLRRLHYRSGSPCRRDEKKNKADLLPELLHLLHSRRSHIKDRRYKRQGVGGEVLRVYLLRGLL